jgi:hypothetical protein
MPVRMGGLELDPSLRRTFDWFDPGRAEPSSAASCARPEPDAHALDPGAGAVDATHTSAPRVVRTPRGPLLAFELGSAPRVGQVRDTVGWSATTDPSASRAHLSAIARGMGRVDAAVPGLVARLRAAARPNEALLERRADLAAQLARAWPGGSAAPDALGEATHAALVAQLDAIDAMLEQDAFERLGPPVLRGPLLAEVEQLVASLEERDVLEVAEARATLVDVDPSVVAAGLPLEVARHALTRFFALTGDRVEADGLHVVARGRRGHYDPVTRTLDLGRPASAMALLHELGHALEASVPEVDAAARAWRDARCLGSGLSFEPQSLALVTGVAYAPDEVARLDHFVDPYVGRVYGDAASEVVSMGLQHFATSRTLLRFALSDLEHFFLLVGVL